MLRSDMTDYGQALDAVQGSKATWWPVAASAPGSALAAELRGADAVVHLANIPAPEIATPANTFTANVAINLNVLPAQPRTRERN